jgi:hypothetical protein
LREASHQCIESFSGGEDRCARGQRLLGSNPLIERHPQFFMTAEAPDDQVAQARKALWVSSGVPGGVIA